MHKKGSYSYKILELTAKEIGAYFVGTEIVKILEEFGIPKDKIQYPNAKWWTINEAFKYIKENKDNADSEITKLITVFLHPLSHNLNEVNAQELVEKISKIIKYDDFYIEDAGTEYLIFTGDEEDEMRGINEPESDQKISDITFDHELIIKNKEKIKTIFDFHQAFMDIIEIFCNNPSKPTKQLNDNYLYLINKITTFLHELGLKRLYVLPHTPFEGDLYSAESDWYIKDDFGDIIPGPELNWDNVRPELHRVHGQILNLLSISQKNDENESDDKRLQAINNLITENRIKSESIIEQTTKIEVLHRHAKDTSVTFYITKKEDDFYYKGLHILATKKNNDYYKVFCALYAKLPEGGEISYKDLITEIKSRMPEQKSKTNEEMQKFIQRNLTDRGNGFLRYANIPETEDNGRPLISTIRGSGVAFNNKMG